MARRNSTLTYAFCASISAHALGLSAIAWWFVLHSPPPKLAALPRPERAPIIILPPPPKPPPPPPQPKPDFSQASKPLRDDSGEANAKGTANRSTAGDKPMEARRGLEQADLTHTDQKPAEADDSKLAETARPPTPSPLAAAATPVETAPAYGAKQQTPEPEDTQARQPMITIADPSQSGAAPTKEAAKPPAPAPEVKGHVPVTSDTESIPFANANSAHFHDGKMEARLGRRVKTTRIDFGLAAGADALSLSDPTVQLGVTVDAGGNVQNVVILKSSGSNNIDLPCQRSLYNWWFEPKKDKDGHPLPDQWIVTID